RAAEGPPGEAQARREVVLVRLPQPLAGAWAGRKFELVGGRIDERLLAARDFDRVGTRVERGELVDVLNRRQVQFVAEADVERQLGGDLPIILEVVSGTEGLRVVERLP